MKKSLIFLLSVFTLLFFISCGSQPEEEKVEPEAPVEEVVELTAEEEAKLHAEIEAARNKAIEAGAQEKVPEELKKVDDFYASIKDDKKALKEQGFDIPGMYEDLLESIKAKEEAEAAAEEAKKAEAEALAKLQSDIEVARNSAIEAGAELVFPDKLNEIDSLYESLKGDNEKFKAEGQNVLDKYNALAADLKSASGVIANIEASRNKAIEAGAETNAADQLAKIDAYAEEIKKDTKVFDEKGYAVPGMYNALIDYMTAKETKKIIDEQGLASYAENEYKVAVDKLAAFEADLENISENSKMVAKDAADARKNFYTVKTVAYKKMAKDARNEAYAEKKNADSVRAGVSQKDRYKTAVENFQKGDSLYAMQSPEKAKEYYLMAKEEFSALYTEVADKRAEALKAIEAAKKNVEESKSYAVEADEIAPITGEVDGIEDEDTVLLEADNYDDPSLAEIEISENLEEDESEITEIAEDTEEPTVEAPLSEK